MQLSSVKKKKKRGYRNFVISLESYKCPFELMPIGAGRNLMYFYPSLLCRKLCQHRHFKLSYHLAAPLHLLWTVRNAGFPTGMQQTMHPQDLGKSTEFSGIWILSLEQPHLTGTTL